MSSHHHHQTVAANGQLLPQPDRPLAAPEISGGGAIGALLLLAGCIAILTAKRRAAPRRPMATPRSTRELAAQRLSKACAQRAAVLRMRVTLP